MRIATDITERKKAEDAVIRYSEELEEKVRERTAELERFGFSLHKLYEISFASQTSAKDFAKQALAKSRKYWTWTWPQ